MVIALAFATSAGAAQVAPDADIPGPTYASAQAHTHYAWANVLRVDPVYEMVSVRQPRQECRDVQVVRRDGGNTTVGTVLGAVVGGALGNQVGKGDGRKAATIAGAVVGGAVGHGVASDTAGDDPTTQRSCRQVADVHQERQLNGYDVEYRYHGEVYRSQLGYDPGERLRIRISVAPAN